MRIPNGGVRVARCGAGRLFRRDQEIDDTVKRIKQIIGRELQIPAADLNDIALEDVELVDSARENLHQVICELARLGRISAGNHRTDACGETLMPCSSYWVEGSNDLVLYIWNSICSKTVVVPPSLWCLRSDISIH